MIDLRARPVLRHQPRCNHATFDGVVSVSQIQGVKRSETRCILLVMLYFATCFREFMHLRIISANRFLGCRQNSGDPAPGRLAKLAIGEIYGFRTVHNRLSFPFL